MTKRNCQIPQFQKLLKQSSRLSSCTLCVQRAQKQDVAEPPCRPPCLTLTVHGAREGPSPRTQVSSPLALPCPLSWPPTPPGGADAPPCSTSLGAAIVAALVKPKAKRPHETAGRRCSCLDNLPVIPAPETPRPLLVLLGVESDPACTGHLPAIVWRRFSGGWLWPSCPPASCMGPAGCPPVLPPPPPPPPPPGRGSCIPCLWCGHSGRDFPFGHPVGGGGAWCGERLISRGGGGGGSSGCDPPLRVLGRLGTFPLAGFFFFFLTKLQ